MTVFADYARYYNVLYQDKPYADEVNFVLSCLHQNQISPKTLLDLGCGTGRHALEMARCGIAVTGIDMSETMLHMGEQMLQACPLNPLPVLQYGDARTARLYKHFDVVTSLFHVMSYQTSEEDALAVLHTAHTHLKPDGLFLFDFWYGSGVLTDPPTKRHRIMENADTLVERTAEPLHDSINNTVQVHYAMTLLDKHTKQETKLSEIHSMRYWFMPELRFLARQSGFTVVSEGAWMQHTPPTKDTWNAWILLKK